MHINGEIINKAKYEELGIQVDDFETYLTECNVPIVFYISPKTSDEEFEEMIERLVKMQIEITEDQLVAFNNMQSDIFNSQLSNIRNDMESVVNTVSQKVNNVFNAKGNNYSIEINNNEITKNKIVSNISISTKFNNLNTNLHGTGFQRALILLLIKEAMSNGLIEQNILVVDEPEAFIHPTGIEILQELIYDIDNIQTIISTHSPLMISIKNFDRNITVMKQQIDNEINVFSSENNLLEYSEKEILKLQNIANASLFEFLFARKVIVVEGDVEEYIIKSLLEEEVFSACKGITKVINAKGKGTIQNYLKLLNDFTDDYSICFDLDNFSTNKDGSTRSQSAITGAKTTATNLFNLCSENSIAIAVNGTIEYALNGNRVSNGNKVSNCIEILNDDNQKDRFIELLKNLLGIENELDSSIGFKLTSTELIEEKFENLIS